MVVKSRPVSGRARGGKAKRDTGVSAGISSRNQRQLKGLLPFSRPPSMCVTRALAAPQGRIVPGGKRGSGAIIHRP